MGRDKKILTPEQQARLIELKDQGKTYDQIAKMTGIHKETVGYVLRNMGEGARPNQTANQQPKASEPSTTVNSPVFFDWGKHGRGMRPHSTITNQTD